MFSSYKSKVKVRLNSLLYVLYSVLKCDDVIVRRKKVRTLFIEKK